MLLSGPYTLMIGFWYFLISKEIYVLHTAEHVHFKAFIALTYFITMSGLIHELGKFLQKFNEVFYLKIFRDTIKEMINLN